MIFGHALGIGLVGALVIYAARFRHERLKTVVALPSKNWKVLVFDLLIFILCGGLCVAFIIDPSSPKEAFLGGATWEGFMASVIPTKE